MYYFAVCSEPLGTQDYRIKNNEFSSSGGGTPYRARINAGYGWLTSGRKNQYLQVDLRTIKKITAVATQGSPKGYWVKTYKLSYSVTGDNKHWSFFNITGETKVYEIVALYRFITRLIVINM